MDTNFINRVENLYYEFDDKCKENISLIKDIGIKCDELSEKTNYDFLTDSNVVYTKIFLKNYILNSKFVTYLKNNNIIKDNNIEILYSLLDRYSSDEAKLLNLALDIYELCERAEDNIVIMDLKFVMLFSEFIDKNILSDYVIEGNNKRRKTNEELNKSMIDAFNIIKSKFNNHEINEQTYNHSCDMLKIVFENYNNYLIDIDIKYSEENYNTL